jgi:hypothetical protein
MAPCRLWITLLTSAAGEIVACFYDIEYCITVKKVILFPIPAVLFPASESLVGDIKAGYGKTPGNLFYSVPE